VAIKFGIKAGSVLASAVFSLALVAGCNTEEPAPAGGSPPAAPGATPPGKSGEAKPSTPSTPVPPVTPPKDAEKPKS
jgi:hypothetical protein